MPHFRLETNVSKSKIPLNLSQKLCQVISATLSEFSPKPVEVCVATVIGDVDISHGGTQSPAAQATLMSIGALGKEENKKHSKAIALLVEKELGIPSDRMYIQFIDVAPHDIGVSGTTYADLVRL